MVQFGRSATVASSSGVATRNAASLFTGTGPGATRAFSATTPPDANRLRHSRTVSSRTPNAWPIRALVQPDSVSITARARSTSPRSSDPASASRADRSSASARNGDLPTIPPTRKSTHSDAPSSPRVVAFGGRGPRRAVGG